jgi:hypothetical protein
MALQYLTVNTFGTFNRGNPADLVPNNSYIQMDNMWGKPDYQSAGFLNIISKIPDRASGGIGGVMPSAGRARGIWQYIPYISTMSTKNFVIAAQCTTDYTVNKVFAYDVPNNTWYSLWDVGVLSGAYPYEGVQFKDRFYMTFPGVGVYKWNGDTTNWLTPIPQLQDKGGTATAIAGATLTWNATATVTSDIDISALISKGQYIRRSSTSPYWDEVLKVAAGGLSITLSVASSDNGASAVGGAQKSAAFSTDVYFPYIWKDKLWLCGNGYQLYWSVTNDVENYDTTLGAGSIIVAGNYDDYPSGIASLEDYLFIFKETQYQVYKWTGDLDKPIELIRTIKQGCVSHRTIQNIGDALIYFTGKDVRMTNGNEDVSIAYPQVQGEFEYGAAYPMYKYFSATSTSNDYPFSVFYKQRNCYMLYVNSSCYIYDVNEKKWVGKIVPSSSSNVEGSANILRTYGAVYDSVIWTRKTSSAQVQYYYPYAQSFNDDAIIFSSCMDLGVLNKKKKIKYVEFTFHRQPLCATYIGFDWWDFDETKSTPGVLFATNTNAQQYQLGAVVVPPLTDTEMRIKKRFYVNAEVNKFGWMLFEDNTTPPSGGIGTEGWGIIDWTICYEVMETY